MARTWNLLVRADGETQAAQREMRALQRSARNFGRDMMGLGKSLTASVTLPIIGFAGLGIKELMEARTATMQTDKVFKSMGDTVKITRGQFSKLVDDLSDYSGIEGDIVQSNANVALSFKALASNPQLFKDTIRAAVDMSAALGQDTKTSVIQLGKAMQNGAKGAGALARNGTLAKDDIEKLQQMAKDGLPMWKQQEFILKAVNKQYAGQGKNVDPIRMITNAVKDSAEAFAELLLPALLGVAMKLQDVARWSENLSTGQKKLIGVILLVAAAVGPLLMIVGQLSLAWAAMLPVLSAVAVALGTSVGVILGVVAAVGILAAALVAAYMKSESFRNAVNSAFQSIAAVVREVFAEIQATIMVWAGWLTAFWEEHGAVITAVASRVWNAIYGVVSNVLGLLKNVLIAALAIMRGDWSRAWEAIRAAAGNIWGAIKAQLSLAWDGIKAVAAAAALRVASAIVGGLDNVIGAARGIWSSIGTGLDRAWDSIKATAARSAEEVASAIAGKFAGLAGKLASAGQAAGAALANAIRNAVNAILGRIRSISLPSVEIAGKKIGGGHPFAGIPMLADGGIAYGRTLAEIGEYSGARANPEVIAPLDKLKQLIGPTGNVEVHVHPQSGDPEAIARRVAQILGSSRTRMAGAF